MTIAAPSTSQAVRHEEPRHDAQGRKSSRRRRKHRAGESALAEWRKRRSEALRREWRTWTLLLAFTIGAAITTAITEGFAQLVFAGLVGAMLTLLAVGWMIGGDVHSLPWMWGSVGERQTEEALSKLPSAWSIEHDISHAHGNWDHVLVGPAGLFLLDTKSLSRKAIAHGDALQAGRLRFAGARFRGAAKDLSKALRGRCWVHPVVVIWGDFPQQRHEENGVAYVSGREIADWLMERPESLEPDRREELREVVAKLRS